MPSVCIWTYQAKVDDSDGHPGNCTCVFLRARACQRSVRLSQQSVCAIVTRGHMCKHSCAAIENEWAFTYPEYDFELFVQSCRRGYPSTQINIRGKVLGLLCDSYLTSLYFIICSCSCWVSLRMWAAWENGHFLTWGHFGINHSEHKWTIDPFSFIQRG